MARFKNPSGSRCALPCAEVIVETPAMTQSSRTMIPISLSCNLIVCFLLFSICPHSAMPKARFHIESRFRNKIAFHRNAPDRIAKFRFFLSAISTGGADRHLHARGHTTSTIVFRVFSALASKSQDPTTIKCGVAVSASFFEI
jgi:hypothetical protein